MVVYMLSVKVVGPLPTKDHIVKAMVFLVIMYRYESRTIKKAEQMFGFKPAFSLSSFTLIKRLFSSSSLFAVRVISFTYLRLLMFLPLILIPACNFQLSISHDVLSV